MHLGEFTTFFPALLNPDFVMILEIEEVMGEASLSFHKELDRAPWNTAQKSSMSETQAFRYLLENSQIGHLSQSSHTVLLHLYLPEMFERLRKRRTEKSVEEWNIGEILAKYL